MPLMTPEALTARREILVAAGARLGERGLVVAAEGNLSLRLGGGRLLVSPSGRRKDALGPEDLLIVPIEVAPDGDAPIRGSRPSSDIAIHRAIMAARPDVLAIVHAHVPAAMALTLAGQAPDPAALPETALQLPRLPVVPFAPMGSAELAAAIVAALTSGPEPQPGAVVLDRHGALTVGTGRDPDDGAAAAAAVALALDRMELIDVLCRVQRDATLLRAARSLEHRDRS